MKNKLISMLLVLFVCLLSFGCAAAADDALYANVQDYSDTMGFETPYRIFDTAVYEAECDQPGTVVKVKYKTSVYGKEMNRWANVYLPWGYDESSGQRYPVVYFFHGGGCDQTTLLGNPYTRNALDHMIANGAAKPFIVVAPTYYYGRKNEFDVGLFREEMVQDIIPAVEGTFRSYAETTDADGLAASRDYRAVCGFSAGNFHIWPMFTSMMDYCRYFLPCSGGIVSEEEYARVVNSAAENQGRFFIYMSCGGPEDEANPHCVQLAARLRQEDVFHYGTDPQHDNFFFSLSDNPHKDNCTRYYLFNALLDVLFKQVP